MPASSGNAVTEGVDAIALHDMDSVATALRAIDKGTEIAVGCPDGQIHLRTIDAIPIYHKIALVDLPSGNAVRKHGAVIGHTTTAIAAGTLVHIHNLTGKAAGADR